MKKGGSGKEITISGYVTAFEFDERDNVLVLGIATDQTDYVVESNEIMKELLNLLDVEIEATGTVKTDGLGTKHINLRSFRPL